MDELEQAKILLQKYNQKKILHILDKLNFNEQENLAHQILNINLEEIYDLYNKKNRSVYNDITSIEPISVINKNKINEEEFSKIGDEVIKNNQYAVVTMAGGQGTRLGWSGPKGTYKLNIGENGKYIFEIFIDKLKKAKEHFGIEICWYIMTSIENYKDTVDFFEEHNYFGYNKDKVKFFKQSVLPLLDLEGNLLIGKNYHNNEMNSKDINQLESNYFSYVIKKASDGNGSVFKCLKETKMIDDMKQKGIKWVYICGVDNIMANFVDSVFLGLTVKNNKDVASKSIKKSYPEERVGVFCKMNGKPSVIEYSEMSDDLIYAKNEKGEFIYAEANFISHIFKLETIEMLSNIKLEYHLAVKKNSYIDENLNEVVPETSNSNKFEAFIFDVFNYLDDMLILSVNRDEEFAPIKNATGIDSPESAKLIYEKYNKIV